MDLWLRRWDKSLNYSSELRKDPNAQKKHDSLVRMSIKLGISNFTSRSNSQL